MSNNVRCKFFSILCIVIMDAVLLAQSDKLDYKKINECSRCKLLKDSYQHWLEKTSRGKHEGGDAAWEEAKLKSYPRSEMRLVEIQEKLCSELKFHQDHCYAMAEETEQIIEEWWFHKNHNSLDLYHWLCIDHLKYCCPPNHFGEQCLPCVRDKNNKVCAGNGKCDGDGTRKGNGTCICNKGYSGSNCDECNYNFYSEVDVCKPCHQSCDKCNGAGPDHCVECTSGWHMQSGVCIDVNECLQLSTCKVNEYCVNTQGAYACYPCDKTCKTCLGPGHKHCRSCNPDDNLLYGVCLNNNFLKNVFWKVAVYLCLLVIIIVTFKKYKTLASFLILTVSFLLYHFEKS